MPRNDWTEELVVNRVREVEHDIRRQPPTSLIHIIARDGKDGKGMGGGFRCFSSSDIVRVVGTMGATTPRQTAQEERLEEREERKAARLKAREERRAARNKRRASRKG